jgi:hypothetical protein
VVDRALLEGRRHVQACTGKGKELISVSRQLYSGKRFAIDFGDGSPDAFRVAVMMQRRSICDNGNTDWLSLMYKRRELRRPGSKAADLLLLAISSSKAIGP